MEFGRICSVPSRAEWPSITFASDAPVASTNLKCDLGNTDDRLRDWIQLKCVNDLLATIGEN